MLSTLQKSIPVQGHLRLSSVTIFFLKFIFFRCFILRSAGCQSGSHFLGSFATSSASRRGGAHIYSFPPPWARGGR